MSTLKVNAIEPYSGGTVTITGASIDSASYAETANTLTAGNKTINGNVTVTNGEILQTRPDNADVELIQNEAYKTEFYGSRLLWKQGNEAALQMGELNKVSLTMNSFTSDFSTDNLINIQSTLAEGTKFDDWSGTWLTVPEAGSPTFNRNTITNGVAGQIFNAPAADYVDNKEVVRVNNANISGTPYNNVWFGMGQAAPFGDKFEDYFTIEYYDSTGYNYGSELNVNGVQSTIQTQASGSGQVSSLYTRDNGDGTSQVTADSLHVVVPQLGDYADDATAASNGVKLNGLYRTGNVVKIRIV